MTKYFFLYVVAFAAFFASCDFTPKPIDVEIEAPEPELVVSSYAIEPGLIGIALTKTFAGVLVEEDVLNPELLNLFFVDSAEATISYAGQTKQLIQISPTVLGALDLDFIPNEKYVLRAKDLRTGKTISAETVYLENVPLELAEPLVDIRPTDTLASFKYAFTDVPGVENYYLATYNKIGSGGSSPFDSLPGDIFKFQGSYFTLISDINEGDGKFVDIEPIIPNIVYGDTIAISLSNIPKSYYEYLAAYKRSGNLFSSLLAEPITLPSNVQGGYGYFALLNPSRRVIILR
jgi:Domain of unknown function (DUF4249)